MRAETPTTERRAAADVPHPVGTRRRPARRPAWPWLAGFLAVVALAELGVRAASGHLSEPVDYLSPDAQRLVDEMDVLRHAGVRSDITLVGTSMVRRDIDAAGLRDALADARWVHNVALPGAQAPVVERWLLEEVLPRLHPRRVVWGISSLDFNAGRDASTKAILAYDAARATERGLYASLDRWLERSALSRYRDDLRDPLALLHAAEGSTKRLTAPRRLRDLAVWKLGYRGLAAGQIERSRRAELGYIRTQQLRRFEIGGAEVRAYAETLRQLRARGVAVAVVLMPVSSQYIASHPNGSADFGAWVQRVSEVASRVGVPVLDMSRAVPDADFRDYEHLMVEPARRFTSSLAPRLRQLGW